MSYDAMMPARRTRRSLSSRTVEEALLNGQNCRRMMVKLTTEAPVGGPEYRAADGVMKALDALAEALTGDGKLWHGKGHG